MKQYKCPISGCDYTGGSKGSVKGHITRSTDDAHKGESGPEYGEEIVPVDVSGSSSASVQDDGADRDGADRDGADDLEAGPVEFPEADDPVDDVDDVDDAPEECPDCGGDLRELPRGTQFVADDGRAGVTEPGDAQCLGCTAVVTADGEVFP